jgi:putative 4-mercaptohistidine N1-methyltranferase
MTNVYESPKLLAEYLLFHFGTDADLIEVANVPRGLDRFPERVVERLLENIPPPEPGARCLDLGCAVGASCFELARRGYHVTGIDFSAAFIQAAETLRTTGKINIEIPVEGNRTRPFTARVKPLPDPSLIVFEQGDAMQLREFEAPFDIVLASNLLCRLPDPTRFLESLPGLVAPGGLLLLATPFSWLQEFTPPARWIGGHPGDVPSFELLKQALAPSFVLEHCEDIPFLIREHARKFQLGISLGSRWRKLKPSV